MSSVNRLQSFKVKKLNPLVKGSFWELPALILDRILCQFFMNAIKTNKTKKSKYDQKTYKDVET